MRLLERVLGFELKMRQYRDGKRFCDAVVARVGIEGLNRVWTRPACAAYARRARRPGRLDRANGCSVRHKVGGLSARKLGAIGRLRAADL